MIIDAMVLTSTCGFDGFGLATSDSSFTGLAARRREVGLP